MMQQKTTEQTAWERFYKTGKVADYLQFCQEENRLHSAVPAEEQHAFDNRRPDYPGTAYWGK